MTDTNFYRAFEDRYRGSREVIANRLKVYLPFIATISKYDEHCSAIDLGCGRGEWLELLENVGVHAHGVDLDDGMLAACRQQGLSVETAEAVAFLKGLPQESQSIVTGFHIAEHLPFAQLRELVHEALRVLKPAGLLILETPNPENIVVGTANFYIDPSHQRPIPHQLLSFLAEYYGFCRTKVIRLQESKILADNPRPTLLDVLAGVSPDYAVIAQKTAPKNIITQFDTVFGSEYGLSLNTLADRFDERLQEADTKAHRAEMALNAIYNSRAWRWMKPVRSLGGYVHRIKNAYDEDRLFKGVKNRLMRSRFNQKAVVEDTSVLFVPTINDVKTLGSSDRAPVQLALDMYVLGQGVKTGVFRVCEELFRRLALHPDISPRYVVRDKFRESILNYIETSTLPRHLQQSQIVLPSESAEVLLSPFGVAPQFWLGDKNVVHAHIVYDLIAINHPEFFTTEGAAEVKQIIDGLDSRTVIFAISEYTKKDLLAYRPDLSPRQVVVIPLAADSKFLPCTDTVAKSTMRERYGIPQNVPYVLSLATLEVRKNLEQTVRAFSYYLDAEPESTAYLVLAGMTGWKLERLHAEIKKTGKWATRILLIGFVDDCDLPALYSDALCFVYLSRYEGFGLPPLEAMACGTPVICSDCSSLPEVVGNAGMLFCPDDHAGVADAIAKLKSSAAVRDDFIRRGLARAAMFSWDQCCELVVSTLRETIQQRRSD